MSGGGKGFGSQGQAGFLSPFDIGTANAAESFGTQAVVNRYQQLGLGGGGAMPSGPTTGAVPGIPGSGTTPTTGGSFASPLSAAGGTTAGNANAPSMPANRGFGSPAVANMGAGPTAMQMDIGTAPSLTGGIPAEFQALLGEAQTADMAQTAGGGGGSGKGGKGGGGIGALGSLAKMGGK